MFARRRVIRFPSCAVYLKDCQMPVGQKTMGDHGLRRDIREKTTKSPTYKLEAARGSSGGGLNASSQAVT